MTAIAFSKLVPGGNSTILLTRPDFAPDALPDIAERLMHPLHVQAEQVGALSTANRIPHLQMMGGEFCVNATRSAALLLDRMGRLAPLSPGCRHGKISVSGMASPVCLLTADTEDALRDALSQRTPPRDLTEPAPASNASCLFCAARIACGAGSTRLLELDEGVVLVHLPGISHLLVDALRHPMPADWSKAAAAWRRKAGLDTAPASGVVWHFQEDGKTRRIQPAVAVRATRSEHMETACGSASLALALMAHLMEGESVPAEMPLFPRGKNARPQALTVMQPSGEALNVLLDTSPDAQETDPGRTPSHAWVFGPVHLVAEGTAYL